MANKLRVGVIGLGNMGSGHAQMMADRADVDFVAVCDIDRVKADSFAEKYGTTAYYDAEDMMNGARLDAITIATPHYFHTPIAIDAFNRGLHVLCEKPIAVHVNDAEKMLAAYDAAKAKNDKIVFAIMYQERTLPFYLKIKDILAGGELGKLTRVTWINTAWFRSQAYYNSGGWRATWAGEGGGILTNQCPHTLDMYHWLFGMPSRVNGFAHIGKYHDIEVEDEVTAYMEHANGMIGHFILTTGECPGENRLEIAGENGLLVYQNNALTFRRNRMSMLKYSRTTDKGFEPVETWDVSIPVNTNVAVGHEVVAERFVKSALTGDIDLIAHACEGLNPVMLANGIMLSSFTNSTVHFPLNGDAYEAVLKDLIAASKYIKPEARDRGKADFERSLTR